MPLFFFKLRPRAIPRFASLALLGALLGYAVIFSRPTAASVDTRFKVGERITYTVSFEKFSNVAYAELYTVSRGKLGSVEAVELRARVKTLNFISAAFYLIDESRTVFVAPDSGLPLYIVKTRNVGGLPKETIQNELTAPTGNFDLVSMIYKIRHSESSGSFNISEGEKIYTVTFQTTGGERVKTDAGEFDTTVVNVQCEYFTEIGIRDFRMNLSTDEAKVPVVFKFRTAKGEFTARFASIQNLEPQPEPTPTPSVVVTPRPTPAVSATPTPVPPTYFDNRPLSPDLSFDLGETLEYRLSTGGKAIANFVLNAAERKQVQGVDSLILTATVTDASAGPFVKGDSIRTVVDPETLGPRQIEMKFSGGLAAASQAILFDEKTNTIMFNGASRIEAPVGTHGILSLLYAMRSFNLKPSRDTSNPINDTRVAVFWENRPYVFTLRPSTAENIKLQDTTVSAQMISVTTGNQQLDGLNLKVWLSNDSRRVPLRFSVGPYQADLVSERMIPPR